MIFQSKRVYINQKFIEAQIEIKDNKIFGVYKYNEKPVDVDYGELRILPGFYDIHTHGYKGYDTSSGEKEGLRNWAKYLPQEGVCGFLPTTTTFDTDTLKQAVKKVKEVAKEDNDGAQILGIHFEGPYIDINHRGAQPEKYILKPSVESFKEFQKACDNFIKIITLAPENDENFELIKYCASTGVNASIGHTSADFKTAMKAIENGAKGFTHTYNGMSGFSHRENGVVGACFVSDNFAEIIADGNHTTIAALKIFFKQKTDKGILITDSLMCKGYPVGSKFIFGGQEIEIYPDGSAHITQGNKALAGSTLKVNEGLKLLIEKAEVNYSYAIDAVSINPMKYLNMDDHKGLLKEGYDADIVVLNDDYSIIQTYCLGKAML